MKSCKYDYVDLVHTTFMIVVFWTEKRMNTPRKEVDQLPPQKPLPETSHDTHRLMINREATQMWTISAARGSEKEADVIHVVCGAASLQDWLRYNEVKWWPENTCICASASSHSRVPREIFEFFPQWEGFSSDSRPIISPASWPPTILLSLSLSLSFSLALAFSNSLRFVLCLVHRSLPIGKSSYVGSIAEWLHMWIQYV